MRDLNEEPAMLTHLNEQLAQFEAVVTYNGKCFDMPLIQDRYITNRMRSSLSDPAHFDLLFPCRRLWRERLGACDLGTVERGVLAYTRREDIPSALIPQIYFDYIRRRDPRRMRLVFAHNIQDIVSMWALTVKVCQSWSDSSLTETHPVDLYSLGRAYVLEDRHEDAISMFEGALTQGLPQEFEWQAQVRLSLALKKTGERTRAAEIWEDMCQGGFWSGFPYIELAKHYEHTIRDIDHALEIAQEGLRVVTDRESTDRDDLEYRLARLIRKAGVERGK